MMNGMRVSAERQEQKIDELLSKNDELLSKNDELLSKNDELLEGNRELLERGVDAEERGAQLQDTLDVVHHRLQRVLGMGPLDFVPFKETKSDEPTWVHRIF
ncbi:MAG TPA: hypothetical protein VFQ26_03065 [Nitrospiraceae bacterium]|nr:hypothetical protein [Nitrospiraceae bacterium]